MERYWCHLLKNHLNICMKWIFNWYPFVYGCISSLRSNMLSASFSSTVGVQSVIPGQVGQLIPPACCGSGHGFPLSWTQEHGQGRSRPYGQKTELLRLAVLIKLSSHVCTVALTAPLMGCWWQMGFDAPFFLSGIPSQQRRKSST